MLMATKLRSWIKKISSLFNNLPITHPKKLKVATNEKILIIAPHPDDESIGCGGLLLNNSVNCFVLCLTKGGKGIPGLNSAETKIIRENEFRNAMKYAGVKMFKILDMPDGNVSESETLKNWIINNQFSLILFPNLFDQHPDHIAVGKMIKKLLIQNHFSANQQFGFYEVWNALPIVNYFTDISDRKEEKINLIKKHESQCKIINYHERIVSLNYFRGIQLKSCDYAECYLILNKNEMLKVL